MTQYHRPTDWKRLERAIHYTFREITYLQQALTHRSYSSEHNERLEFLGDALLETVISTYLFRYYPKAKEGDLTRLRAALVKGDNLALIAKSLALGDFLQLGEGELKSGGTQRDSILADAVEAMIAAVYLDSDFVQCEQTTLRLFADSIKTLPDIAQLKDAKSQLQEYLQAKNIPLPIYELTAQSGPEHARKFTVTVYSQSKQYSATDSSRKKAEQSAAFLMLQSYIRD